MNRLIMKIAATTVWVVAGTALGQSEAFTYQGQLKLQGVPLSEEVDMKFTLFDSESAIEAIAGPIMFDGISLPSIQVTNGLFSAELDFGPGALQLGQWIEIEVRSPHDPTDANPYTALTPRQRLSAAPFALSVPGLATTQAGVEVAGDIHAAGEVSAGAYDTSSNVAGGRDYIMKTQGVECARIDQGSCNLGIGGSFANQDPQAKLQILGTPGVDGIMFPDGSMQTTAAIGGVGGVGGSGTVNTIPFWSSATTLSNSQITQNANGVQLPNGVQLAVGAQGNGISIGSPNGETGLTIAGPTGRADLRFGTFTTAETILKLVVRGAGSGPPAETNGIAITTAGNVGIGVATPASKLDIRAMGEGAELLRFGTERPWVFRQVRTGPSTGLQLLSTVGQKKFEITAVEGNNVATFFADGVNSRVGIGTIDPVAKLDVYGSSGNAIVGTHNGNGQTAGVFGYSPMLNGNGVIGQADVGSGSYGVWGRSFSGVGGFFSGGTYALVADGRAKVDILEIAGADVAEKFLSIDENIEPGTVMEIDAEHPGQIRIARQAYSSLVAGVVSGAGDIPVGAILGNLPGHEKAPPIALSGRVWVRCDASSAAIAAGDLLTTAELSGHAMKASDRNRSHGAVIGKAMSALAQGERGLVLVLVNLQ